MRISIGAGALAIAVSMSAAWAQSSVTSPLAAAERSYEAARAMKDAMDVARARGVALAEGGDSLRTVARRYAPAVRQLDSLLKAVDSLGLDSVDRRALRTMRRTAAVELNSDSATAAAPDTMPPDCRYDPAAIAALSNGLDSLSTRMYACYGYAAQHVTYGTEHLDRLTILGRLTGTDSAAERERLFRALAPVFRSMNADDGATSPYRTMVRLSAQRWKERGSPVDVAARLAGADPRVMESWLVSILERWRQVTPDTMIQPWDYDYLAGHADRKLDPLVKSRGGLAALNAAYFRALGADVDTLQVRYDLVPREGKTPVAYTTFGRRSRLDGGRWISGDEWIFATYKFPGIGNLNELLHESGHAVHIAAIRTRPAFFDWPDDDAFTEGLADIAALEVYEPAWQAKWLGDSVPLAEAMRARYSAIMMDACWALFEIRMHADPAQDPNAVWIAITSKYLHIKAHPELSWWARRGQLVDLPGYMANYAIGAIIIADIRARLISQHGDFALGDPTWYGWVAPRLYRFGLERSSKQVIEDFLGRPLSPQALLDDLDRMAPARSGVRRD
jgi:hypothetical protein